MCGIALVLEALSSSASAGADAAIPTATSTATSSNSACSTGGIDCSRVGARFEQELLRKLHQRGPDHVDKRIIALTPRHHQHQHKHAPYDLTVYASVLHLRGDALFPQPVVDADGNVLCWNGEVFGGVSDAIGVHENDTKYLSEELRRVSQTVIDEDGADADERTRQRILDVVHHIHGPFAFVWFHRATQRLYFGHDRFGRRSLLHHCADAAGEQCNVLSDLASNSSNGEVVATSISQHTLARLCLSSVAITSTDDGGNALRFEEVPSNGVFVLDLYGTGVEGEENGEQASYRLEFHPYPELGKPAVSSLEQEKSLAHNVPQDAYSCGLPLLKTSSSAPLSPLEDAANGLLVALSNAVGIRVRTIPQAPAHTNGVRVAILFSGGLDSVVLAALTHFHVPENEPIDLLNVCFDTASQFQSPDRMAAEISYGELQTLFPSREWHFVRVNVPFPDVVAQQRTIYELMTPCDTHMDFNIGAAFWFLARAQGSINAHNSAVASGVQLADLNAFLNGSSAGNAMRLIEASIESLHLFNAHTDTAASPSSHQVDSILCAVVNCKRKQKPGCLFGICRVCCFKIQKCITKLLAEGTHVGEKQKCIQNLLAMGIPDEGLVLKLLQLFTSEGDSSVVLPDCRVHRAKTPAAPSSSTGTEHAAPFASTSSPPNADADQPYTSTARVLLVGIGADEQLAGYGRHRTAFLNGGTQALRDELAMDMRRIWKRNLGRDDRCISAHGKEARFPFLDESVVTYLSGLPIECICDLAQERGQGDKLVLRMAARQLGLQNCTGLAKRAIQFGTRIAKHSNVVSFGSNRQATGEAKFHLHE
ncbi:Vacuolar protein sorting-associated protein 33a, partial [Globisporangium splendens]